MCAPPCSIAIAELRERTVSWRHGKPCRQNTQNRAETRCHPHAPFPPTGSTCSARTGRRPAGGALPWLAGIVLFLAAPDPGARRRRLPCRGARHARLRPDQRAGRCRRLQHLRQCRRHGRAGGGARRKAGRHHRPRLGRAGRLARGDVPAGYLHRGRGPQRSAAVPRPRPAARNPAEERHHQFLLAVFSDARGCRGRVRARRRR